MQILSKLHASLSPQNVGYQHTTLFWEHGFPYFHKHAVGGVGDLALCVPMCSPQSANVHAGKRTSHNVTCAHMRCESLLGASYSVSRDAG